MRILPESEAVSVLTCSAEPGGCWCFQSRTGWEIERPPQRVTDCFWFNLTAGAGRGGTPSDTQPPPHPTTTLSLSRSLTHTQTHKHTLYSDEWVTLEPVSYILSWPIFHSGQQTLQIHKQPHMSSYTIAPLLSSSLSSSSLLSPLHLKHYLPSSPLTSAFNHQLFSVLWNWLLLTAWDD